MYNSFGETLANEWTPKTVCESRADWLKFEDLSNRDQLVSFDKLWNDWGLVIAYLKNDTSWLYETKIQQFRKTFLENKTFFLFFFVKEMVNTSS